ncbi:MAG: GDP-mannose 4,6-dehydratase, partial [Vicinamibacterales bacterium]
TGFAGSHLLDHLLEREPRVVGWGNPRGRQVPDDWSSRVEWTSVDVTDLAAIERALTAHPPSVVYHCAGFADVQRASADSTQALRVNVIGTHALLTALERCGLRVPVLVTGSALVYRPSSDALTEESPLGPANAYGISKLAQEMVARRGGPHVIVARPFNHAGPRQSDAYVTSSFARQIAEAEAGVREPILRVGNLDSWRDITDVRDTVRAYTSLVERGRPGVPYNVCRGEAYRVGDLLDRLVRQSKRPIRVEADPARFRPSDNPVVLGSAARLRADTGWEPRISMDRTLADLLDYWRQALSSPPGA